MIRSLRDDYNRRYTDAAYQAMLAEMDAVTRTKLQIRIAETPVFMPEAMVDDMAAAGAEMTHQLVGNPAYLKAAAATIPPAFHVAAQDAHPNFMTVDFGLVHTGVGPWQGDLSTLEPRLVELQAFPSVYGYQDVLAAQYRKHFALPESLAGYPGGMTNDEYWELLRQVVVGNHSPEHVVLMEVTPDQQKTLPDFHIHADRLGIGVVDIANVRQRGRQLFYEREGAEVQIKRIYNRAIADEMVRKGITPGFSLNADLDVEWAGHPNWYFLISKVSLPYLQHRYVPPAVFLNDWMEGRHRDRLSADRSQWVLKPLFSFAGRGIEFAPSDDMLHAIPPAEQKNYLLQQRMHFVPTIATPFGMTQVEVRILYLWPDGCKLTPVQTLMRLGRGAMMGVDHNRNQEWVGGSAGFFERPHPARG